MVNVGSDNAYSGMRVRHAVEQCRRVLAARKTDDQTGSGSKELRQSNSCRPQRAANVLSGFTRRSSHTTGATSAAAAAVLLGLVWEPLPGARLNQPAPADGRLV